MKQILLIFVALCFLAGCENTLNPNVSLTVKNDTSNAVTFQIEDSFNGALKGTYTINAGETRIIEVSSGFYKQTPFGCVWIFENNIWVIKNSTATVSFDL